MSRKPGTVVGMKYNNTKLWQLKRGDRFRISHGAGEELELSNLSFVFDHVNGAYALCTFADGPNKGEVITIDATVCVKVLC